MGSSVSGVSVDKLWPYQVPVVRPQVAASDGAIGNALYGDRRLFWHWPLPACPARNVWRMRRYCEGQLRHSSPPIFRKVVMEIHRAIISLRLFYVNSHWRVDFVSVELNT